MSASRMIGKYEIQAVIGKGPRATVYRGVDSLTQQPVVVKVIGAEALAARALEPFRKYAPGLARVRHPAIAGFIEMVEQDGRVCVVSQLVEGTSLANLLRHGAHPDLKKSWEILRTLLETLGQVHQQGAIHRELKPGNILVNAEGRLYIVDFGTAMLYAARGEGYEYQSPEHFRGEKLTARSDIYQAGVIAYQLVTGRLPFTGGVDEVAHRVAEERPSDPSSYNHKLAWQLDWVIQKALSKDQVDRFNTAFDFGEGLRLGLQDTLGIPLPGLALKPVAAAPKPSAAATEKPTSAAVEAPAAKVETPSPKVEAPAAKPALAAKVETPSPKIEAPAAKPAPAAKVETPSPKVEAPAAKPAPAAKVEAPAAKPVAAPKVEPAVPKVEAPAPRIEIAAPKVETAAAKVAVPPAPPPKPMVAPLEPPKPAAAKPSAALLAAAAAAIQQGGAAKPATPKPPPAPTPEEKAASQKPQPAPTPGPPSAPTAPPRAASPAKPQPPPSAPPPGAAPPSPLMQNAKVLAQKPASASTPAASSVPPLPPPAPATTPVAAAPVVIAANEPAQAAGDPSKSSILFVDDDPRILNSLRSLFRQEYNVHIAESGEAALKVLATTRVQVVVSDQRMPVMLGVDLLRQVKLIAPQAVRLLLTGYTDLASLVGSINHGEIFRFVMKPWENEELKHAVTDAMREAEQLAAASPTKPAAPRSAGSLLLIDPNEAMARGLERLLSGAARVIRVDTPADAAKVLSREEVAVVVADMGSGMDGLVALFRELRAKLPGVLSILLTDEPDSDLAIELINRAQIFRLLPKPVNARDLRTQVAEALRRYSIYKQRLRAASGGNRGGTVGGRTVAGAA